MLRWLLIFTSIQAICFKCFTTPLTRFDFFLLFFSIHMKYLTIHAHFIWIDFGWITITPTIWFDSVWLSLSESYTHSPLLVWVNWPAYKIYSLDPSLYHIAELFNPVRTFRSAFTSKAYIYIKRERNASLLPYHCHAILCVICHIAIEWVSHVFGIL